MFCESRCYRSFAPFSSEGKGIDVALARALAAKLGVKPDVVAFEAGEELSDDLRNMVWKGHYLAGAAGDVMLHVPVDAKLEKENPKNPQVRIVAPYYREQMAVLRNVNAVPKLIGLEALTRVKIGVESDSLAQVYLLGALGGRFAANVVQFRDTGACGESHEERNRQRRDRIADADRSCGRNAAR